MSLWIILVLASIGLTPVAQAEETWKAECPPTIKCVVVPAAYTANNGDVSDYGNYDKTNRPSDMAINSIIIHDGEGSLKDILDHFQDPKAYVSSQYVVGKDGTVYQMVRNKDLPWHAGSWWYNAHGIGIEHEGHAATGATDYTPALYYASAELVKYLTKRFNIPRDRSHIIGHDNIPAPKTANLAAMHTDPGPYWNWQAYMALIGAPSLPSGGFNSGWITIAPVWPLHKELVTGCSVGNNGCAPGTAQPVNFVYLHTEPKADAPLFVDPVLGAGTTDIKNNNARLFYGQTFAVAERKLDANGMWYKIWVNGTTGWVYSPWRAMTVFPAAVQQAVAPVANTPVYGRPSPSNADYEKKYEGMLSVWPASFWIPQLAPTAPLAYTLQPGQRYQETDSNPPNDHYYAWTIDGSTPHEHEVYKGSERYKQIQLGNRLGFVKVS